MASMKFFSKVLGYLVLLVIATPLVPVSAQDTASHKTTTGAETQAVATVIAAHRDHLRGLRDQLQVAKSTEQVEKIRQEIKSIKSDLEINITKTRLSYAMTERRLEDAARLQQILVRWQEQKGPRPSVEEKSARTTGNQASGKGDQR